MEPLHAGKELEDYNLKIPGFACMVLSGQINSRQRPQDKGSPIAVITMRLMRLSSFIFCLAFTGHALAEPGPVLFSGKSVTIYKKLMVLLDPDDRLTIADVSSPEIARRFVPGTELSGKALRRGTPTGFGSKWPILTQNHVGLRLIRWEPGTRYACIRCKVAPIPCGVPVCRFRCRSATWK